MSKKVSGFIALFLMLAPIADAGTFTWDNESGDNAWTNPQNWTNNAGLPGKADTVVFDNTKIGLCRVETNAIVAYLIISNSGGTTVEFDIPPGYVLAPVAYRQGYNVSVNTRVVMSGGGTFAPTGDVWVAFQGSDAGAGRYIRAELVVSNLVFDSTDLFNLYASYNAWSIGSLTGTLDLANATIAWRGNTNMLVTKGEAIVGGSGGASYGTMLLPGTLTNITVKGNYFYVGAYNYGTPALIHFGTNCALRSISVSNTFQISAGKFVYEKNGITSTGLPETVDLEIGAPGKPGKFNAGYSSTITFNVRVSDFYSFRSWLSQLWIGPTGNNAAGNTRAEVDLSENSVTNLEGCITSDHMWIADILIGSSGQGVPTGILRLPSTLTNIVCNSFSLGTHGQLAVPTNSLLDLGTNMSPVTFVVSNNLSTGFAEFRHVTPAGATNNAFPAGSHLLVGQPNNKGLIKLGQIAGQTGRSTFGKGFEDVTVYASNMTVGLGGNGNHWHYITNDFRDATSFFVNVEAAITMGVGLGDRAYVYYPPGSVACSNLTLGQNDALSYDYRAYLELSNTVFTVKDAVVVKESGVITNYVNGLSSGLDIGTTQLDLQDPNLSSSNAFSDYGRLDIRFVSDPADPFVPYWGLRMKGDGTGVIQTLTLTNSTFPFRRLTWNTNGLSEKVAARFGIQYDSFRNVTYVGVKPLVRGTMLLVR